MKFFLPARTLPEGAADGEPVILGLVGGVLLIAELWGVSLAGLTQRSTDLSFLFLVFILPLASALILMHWEAGFPAPMAKLAKLLCAAALAATAVFGIGLALWPGLANRFVFPAVIALALGGTALWFRLRRRADHAVPLPQGMADYALVATFLAAMAVFGPLDPGAPMPFVLIGYLAEVPNSLWWLLGGAAVAALAVPLCRLEAAPLLRGTALFAAVIFTLLLYDDGHAHSIMHFMPYVGPALQTLAGGMPMRDSYSQYGLMPWLLIVAAFEFLPRTFGTAAVLVHLVNVAYFLVYVLILYSVSNRKPFALLLAVPMLLFGITFADGMANLNTQPSAFGFRHLPPALLALVLASMREGNPRRWTGLAILGVSALWSVETCAYCLAVWGTDGLLSAIRRRSWRDAWVCVASALGVVAAVQLILAGAVFAASGKPVDYRPYFALVLNLTGTKEALWALPFNPRFGLWVLAWLAYFLTLALATLESLRGEAAPGTATRLAPLAMTGISILSYFVERPSVVTLGLTFFPFAVITIRAAEEVFQAPRRLGPMGPAIAGALFLLLSLMTGIGAERFSRPISDVASNSTILRRCFADEGCGPGGVAQRVSHALHLAASNRDIDDPRNVEMTADDTFAKMQELLRILPLYAGAEKRPALLPDDNAAPFIGMMVLAETGQWYAWPTSSPFNDNGGALMRNRIIKAASIHDGQVLIVARDERELIPVEHDILEKLRQACRFSTVAELRFFAVSRAEGCAAAPGGRSP